MSGGGADDFVPRSVVRVGGGGGGRQVVGDRCPLCGAPLTSPKPAAPEIDPPE